jgi:hypothetical protein
VDFWWDGDGRFAEVPPIAVLSIFSKEEVYDVVVEPGDPCINGGVRTDPLAILDSEIPEKGGP